MRPSVPTALLLLALASCRLEHHPPPVDTSSIQRSVDSVGAAGGLETGEELTSFRRDRHFDFTGDGVPEEIKVRASGPRSDGLEVTLRIEDPSDSVIYADSWSSAYYLKYTDARTRADRRAVRALVQSALERLVADSSLGAPVADRLRQSAEGAPENRLQTVRRDVAERIWREKHDMAEDSVIPPEDFDSLEALVRTRPDRARVQRLLSDVDATDRYYMYHRGGEETLAIAWSPREKRFVRIWHCC